MTQLKVLIPVLASLGALGAAGRVRADEPTVPSQPYEGAAEGDVPTPPGGAAQPVTPPDLPPPEMMPFPPPDPGPDAANQAAEAADPEVAEAPPSPPVPQGQWSYTSQYGWVWMPYEQSYTQVYPDAEVAYAFVYYPVGGWRWVNAPWVLGFGPRPYWGNPGVRHFAWYARPWFRAGVGVGGARRGFQGGGGFAAPQRGFAGHPSGGAGRPSGGHSFGGGRSFGGGHGGGGHGRR